jgi:conjugative transposon TraN protein
MGLVFHFFVLCGFGQAVAPAVTTIAPSEITISYNKTTNLIFPYAIRSVDRGNDAVIVQKAKGIENILQAKAGKKDFEPTNLTVVTADGRFYSFILNYADYPSHLNYRFDGSGLIQLVDQPSNALQLERAACQVLSVPRFMGLQRSNQALRIQLNGILMSENNLWIKLQLRNHSQVDYKPDYVRFFLRDSKRSKRTALHETEIFPVYTPAYKVTKGETSSLWTIGFKAFTVPKHHRLIIHVTDESGGRTVILPVKSKFFLRAHKLPS